MCTETKQVLAEQGSVFRLILQCRPPLLFKYSWSKFVKLHRLKQTGSPKRHIGVTCLARRWVSTAVLKWVPLKPLEDF